MKAGKKPETAIKKDPAGIFPVRSFKPFFMFGPDTSIRQNGFSR